MAARARPCAARPRLFGFIATPNGALCAPPPIAASLLLIRSLKIDKKLSNSGRPRNGLSRNKMLSFRLKIGPPASWDFFFPLDCYTLLILLFLSLLILLVLFFLFLFFSSSRPRKLLWFFNTNRRCDRKSTKIFGRWEILLTQPVGMASKSTTAAKYVYAPLVMVSLGAW